MSKALVIKDADFSVNKIETINLIIPCSGVSFNSETNVVNKLGAFQIGYTLTPSNTSDALSITSTDHTVVAVNGNAIEAVGLGTCTLTVTCGNYSDTCEVTVDVDASPLYVAAFLSAGTDEEENTGVTISTSTKRVMIADNLSNTIFVNPLTGNTAIDYGDIAPIQIPLNATKIHIEGAHLYSGNSSAFFFENTDVQFSTGPNTFTKILSQNAIAVTNHTLNGDIDIPLNARGVVLVLRQDVSYNTIFDNCTTKEEVAAVAEETFAPIVEFR